MAVDVCGCRAVAVADESAVRRRGALDAALSSDKACRDSDRYGDDGCEAHVVVKIESVKSE